MEEYSTLKPKLRLESLVSVANAIQGLRIGRRVVDSATQKDMKNLTYNLLKAPLATQKGMKNLTYKFLQAPNSDAGLTFIGRRSLDSATQKDMENLTYKFLIAPLATQKDMKNLTYNLLKAPNGSPAKSLRLVNVTVGRLHQRPECLHRLSQE